MEGLHAIPPGKLQRATDTLTTLLDALQEARRGRRQVEAASLLCKASARDAAWRAVEQVKQLAPLAARLIADLPDLLKAIEGELAASEQGPGDTPAGLLYNSPIPQRALSTRALNALTHARVTTLGDFCTLQAFDLLLMRNLGQVTYEEIVAYRAQLGVPVNR